MNGWLYPSGKWVSCDIYKHEESGNKILKEQNTKIVNCIDDTLLNLGFVKVWVTHGYSGVSAAKPQTMEQLDFILKHTNDFTESQKTDISTILKLFKYDAL